MAQIRPRTNPLSTGSGARAGRVFSLVSLAACLAAAACGSEQQGDPATGLGGTGGGGSPGTPGGPSGSAGVGGSSAGGAGGAGGVGGAGGAGGGGGSGNPDGAGAPAVGDASAAPAPTPPLTPAVCSDPGPDPTPIAGFVKAEPVDTRFPFSTHFMGRFSDNPRCVSMTSLTDLDNDGDQDFASGQRDVACSGQTNPNAPMIWWEYCSPDHWVRHVVATGFKSAAAGGAADFDGDGWIDLTAGDSWFKNPGPTVRTAASWMRFPTGAPGVAEETTVGDLNGDGKLDVLHVERSIRPQWWSPGPDATRPWVVGAQLPYNQQQGGAIGDLDGDGRNDIVVGDRWWYRSTGMAGAAAWPPVPITETRSFAPGSPANGSAPIVMLGDLDGDGDLDLVLQQHWGSRVAWIENGDGKGLTWVEHMIAGPGGPFAAKARNILHGLLVNDFDNDGDIDVLAGENQGTLWIFENTDGKGGTFAEHVVANGPTHEARAADVDCDGDLDIAGKPWGDPNDGPAGSSETLRLHVYFKNELVERGGRALFERPKGEVWNVPNRGICKR